MLKTHKLLFALALTVSTPGVYAADSAPWPNFLGPNRDGVVEKVELKTDWSNGLEQKWSAQIGRGFASMAVAEGRLYAMGHEGGKETVFAFDAKTGKKIWSHSYRAKLVDNLHEGGPSATPTYHDGKLYTFSKEGHLHCFDAASGDVVYQVEVWKVLGVKMPTWGFCSSPLVDDGKVYLEAGSTAAFDAKSGDLVWKTKKYKPGYGSIMQFERGGKKYIAAFNAMGLLIVNPKDGEEVASFEWETKYDVNAATPIAINKGNLLFISSGYDRGCALVAFNGKQLAKVWENKNMRNQMNNSVVLGDAIYGFDNNTPRGMLNCIDLKTGEKQWSENGLGAGSLIAVNGKLLVLSERGELLLVNANRKKFDPLQREQVIGGRCWTHPVVADSYVYVRNAKGLLVCLNAGQ